MIAPLWRGLFAAVFLSLLGDSPRAAPGRHPVRASQCRLFSFAWLTSAVRTHFSLRASSLQLKQSSARDRRNKGLWICGHCCTVLVMLLCLFWVLFVRTQQALPCPLRSS